MCSFNRMSTGEGDGTSVFLPWECHEQYERQKDFKDELPRSVGEAINSFNIWFNCKFHLDWRKSNILIFSVVCIIISYIVGTELNDFSSPEMGSTRNIGRISAKWSCW